MSILRCPVRKFQNFSEEGEQARKLLANRVPTICALPLAKRTGFP